jgi:uncharacterized repeat protein (TIGR01451 family)
MGKIAVFIALAFLLLGAFSVTQPVFAQGSEQPGPPSGNGVQPIWVSDNPKCADLAAQFAPGATWNELRLEGGNLAPGTYPDVWEEPGDLVVTIDAYDGTYISWSSNIGVDAVFVKGGRNGNLYQYDSTGFKSGREASGDTGLHSPINPTTSQPYGISHVSFCYDKGAKGGGEQPTEPDPVIIKRSEPSEALPGQEVTFTLEVTNQGNESAVGVVVTDEVSEYLEILEVTTTQGTVTIEGQKITVDIGVVGPGFVVEIVIRARVRDDAPSPLEIENFARLTSHNGGERISQTVILTVYRPLPVTGGLPAPWLICVLLGGALMAAGMRMSRRGVAR